MKVVIVNDASDTGHFGCVEVMRQMRKHLEARDIQLIGTLNRKIMNEALLDSADLIIVNGEGSIHSDNYRHLLRMPKYGKAVLINASIEALLPTTACPLDRFEFIAVREHLSAEYLLHHHHVRVDIVPDVMFGMTYDRLKPYHNVFLSDSSSGGGLGVGFQPRNPMFLMNLAHSKRACMGRFHGVIAAAIMGVPFSAYGGNTWKIKSLLDDMGVSFLYTAEWSSALSIVPNSVHPAIPKYIESARKDINRMFDRIAEL